MVAVLLWTAVPLAALHLWMWRKSKPLLSFQLVLDIVLAAVVGPALVLGADLDPVRCLQRNQPFASHSWASTTTYQPTQSDLVLQFHPWWEAARRQVLEGRMPLIAEEIGGGLPLLANGQTGLWAPVMAPVWVLGPERGTTVMALWKLEAAGLGAFLLMFRGWRLRREAAALGAVAYAGGAYQVAWLLVPLSWTTAALPWLWWLMVVILRRRSRWWTPALAGVLLGWLLGCGLHPETAAIVIGSALLGGLVFHPGRWIRVVAAAVVAVLFAAALAWPTIGYIGASARLGVTHEHSPNLEPVPSGLRPLAIRQMLLPMVNGHPGRGDWRAPFAQAPAATGVGGVALALLALGSVRRRHRRFLWAALAGLGFAAVLFFRLPPLDGLLVRLPPLDRMTLPRFAALVPWGLAVWAALAADGALRGRVRWWGWWAAAPALLLVVAVLSRPWELAGADLALVGLTLVAAAVLPLLLGRPRLLAPLVAAELALYALGINPLAAAEDRLPRPELVLRLQAFQAAEGGRVMGVDGVFPANLAGRYGLADLRAYDPLRPQPFAAMMAALGQPDPILGGAVREAPLRLLGAWSVRFLLTPAGAEPPGWERLWHDADGALWRNPEWLPELRVVGRAVTGGWDVLTSEKVDFTTTAVVPDGSARVAAGKVAIEPLALASARISAVVSCDGPCLVVLARPWAPGWRASIDGTAAPLVRANLAGLGLVAPPGRHEVVLSYNPWRWWE
ncbi:MAG: hypothetical protein ACC742_14480, partial [Thermoanaerobaculales bacterium]